jgi:hypothetical protein
MGDIKTAEKVCALNKAYRKVGIDLEASKCPCEHMPEDENPG